MKYVKGVWSQCLNDSQYKIARDELCNMVAQQHVLTDTGGHGQWRGLGVAYTGELTADNTQ